MTTTDHLINDEIRPFSKSALALWNRTLDGTVNDSPLSDSTRECSSLLVHSTISFFSSSLELGSKL